MDRRTDGGDYNIPFAFLKKRGDNNHVLTVPFGHTGVPAKSDSDIIFCLQLLSQILTCTPHLP